MTDHATKPAVSQQWHREANVVFDEEVAAMDRWRDPDTGMLVIRMTTLPYVNTHIYPETPISSPDGRYFVWQRANPLLGESHFWIADTQTLRIRQITDEVGAGSPVYPPDGSCLYYSVGRDVYRMDATTFTRRKLWTIPEAIGSVGAIRTISADGKRGVFAHRRAGEGENGASMIDLETGDAKRIVELPDCLNAHVQCCRKPGSDLISIQVNDGIERDAAGNITRLIGDDGASLWLCRDDGSDLTKLNVGSSPLEHVQGHQCWLGQTERKITTMHRREKVSDPWMQDRIAVSGAGDETYDIVGEGEGFTHIHTTLDGRFWVADCNRTSRVFVGSVKTGRYRLFVNTGATFGAHQSTHPHPFFLGDDRQIGWNSDVTGIPHIYFAAIPDGWMEELEA